MADPLKKLKPGESLRGIPAEAWNAFVDVAQSHRAQRGGGPSLQVKGLPPGGHPTVLVRNESGDAVPRFGVLELGDPLIEPGEPPDGNTAEFQSRITFAGTAPTDASATICITLEPLAEDAIGRAIVMGAVPVRIRLLDAAHGYAQPAAGETEYLQSCTSGPAKILYLHPEAEELEEESGGEEEQPELHWAYVALTGDESEDDCSATTTTTTTTTPEPCAEGWAEWEWDDEACEWTETDSTCSGGCVGLYPSFCGDDVCATTITMCAHSRGRPTPDCDCGVGSSTTTTTTTAECTTTTPEPPCVIDETTYCDWLWMPPLGRYVKTYDGCPQDCPCAAPDPVPPGEADGCYQPPSTGCVVPPPYVPNPYCRGFIDFYCDENDEWARLDLSQTCGSQDGEYVCADARCVYDWPTTPCECGAVTYSECHWRCPDVDPYPCLPTTSTTPSDDLCDGYCDYVNTDGEWVFVTEVGCTNCGCWPPPYDPTLECERARTGCGTTTTPAPTTTTTTTPEPACTDCEYTPPSWGWEVTSGAWGTDCTSLPSVGTLLHTGDCTWEEVSGGVTITLTLAGTTLELTIDDGVKTATYSGTLAALVDCCTPRVLFLASDNCDDGEPSEITVTPDCSGTTTTTPAPTTTTTPGPCDCDATVVDIEATATGSWSGDCGGGATSLTFGYNGAPCEWIADALGLAHTLSMSGSTYTLVVNVGGETATYTGDLVADCCSDDVVVTLVSTTCSGDVPSSWTLSHSCD